MNKLEQHLKALIEESGPVDVATFMGLAINHYYSTRDPFGAKGDFTTAPEISQMFGEMIGVFLADAWMKMGSPSPVILCEAGPGRGTLMADILRATKNVGGFHEAVQVHLIEISPSLRERQKYTLSSYNVSWHDAFDSLPEGPLLFVANEFLDALPVQQLQSHNGSWHQRVVGLQDGDFVFGIAPVPLSPPSREWAGAPQETVIVEFSPAREDFMRQITARLSAQTGVALLIDYGHDQSAPGDTLQAVKNHQYVDVLSDIGEADLTSHVDFGAIKNLKGSCTVHGSVGQGDFLKALGVELRAARLDKQSDMQRLVADEQMGRLFRVIALCHSAKIELAGFQR